MNLGFFLGPAWREEQWTLAQKQTRGEWAGQQKRVPGNLLFQPRNLHLEASRESGETHWREQQGSDCGPFLSPAAPSSLALTWPDLNASPKSTGNALAWCCGLALHWGVWTGFGLREGLCSSASSPSTGHPAVEAIISATAHLPHSSSTAAASMLFTITCATASHYSYWGTDWVLPTGVMKAP